MTAPSLPPLRSLLVVEDDDALRERLVRAFCERGFDAKGAPTGEAAVASAQSESPELAVVDLRLPGLSGLDVVQELHTIDATTRIVVLTGYGSIATAVEAMHRGATHYLTKPADPDEILDAFQRTEPSTETTTTRPRVVPSLARVEWEHIHRVLTDCDGNISLAARLLGMHRRSLQRKIAKWPVQR